MRDAIAAYFKIHLPGKPFWAICRLLKFGEKRPSVRVRLPAEQVKTLVPSLDVTPRGKNWSGIGLEACEQIQDVGPAIRAAWDAVSAAYGSGAEEDESADG